MLGWQSRDCSVPTSLHIPDPYSLSKHPGTDEGYLTICLHSSKVFIDYSLEEGCRDNSELFIIAKKQTRSVNVVLGMVPALYRKTLPLARRCHDLSVMWKSVRYRTFYGRA